MLSSKRAGRVVLHLFALIGFVTVMSWIGDCANPNRAKGPDAQFQ
jgi:hypothetical protein